MSSRRESQGRSCANCNSRPADKGRGDHLCSKCAHKLPRTQCHYCRTAFHLLAKHSHLPLAQQLCSSCANDRELFGAPQQCSLCRFQAAFDGATLCRHCASDSKRFGAALQCLHCGFNCAFERDAESKAKVDGLTLCFLCTHQFKTIKKKEGAGMDADALREVFAMREAEKRPRDEDVAADIAAVSRSRAAAAEASGGGKRQRLEPPPPQATATAAASSAAAASPFSASPSACPSPTPLHAHTSSFSSPANVAASSSGVASSSPAPSSFSLSGSSPLMPAQAVPGFSSTAGLSTAQLNDRIARLQAKLVSVSAQLATANKEAEEAKAATTRKDKEIGQLRGELEAARRAIGARKDSLRNEMQSEALRNLNTTPNPNHIRAAAAAAAAANQEDGDDDTTDFKI